MKTRDFDLIAFVVKNLPIEEVDSDIHKARSLLGTAFADAIESKHPRFDRVRFFRLAGTNDYWLESTEMTAAVKRLRARLKKMVDQPLEIARLPNTGLLFVKKRKKK